MDMTEISVMAAQHVMEYLNFKYDKISCSLNIEKEVSIKIVLNVSSTISIKNKH